VKRIGKALAFVLTLSLAFSTATAGFAGHKSVGFNDMNANHWAYPQVQKMVDAGIMQGYSDGSFRPNQQVVRDQFSKMMVNSLNIKLVKPAQPSFVDVAKNNWAYSYVETAKPYLTGYNTSEGLKFKPAEDAVREDMAVALVLALGYENASYDDSILDQFADSSDISKNLRKYVAIAVQKNLMKGSKDGSSLNFNPQSSLTRAEASVLLYNVMQDEKIVLGDGTAATDDTKVVVGDTTTTTTTTDSDLSNVKVSASVSGRSVTVNWAHSASDGLQGFKVVASQGNSHPSYPNDGYFFWITDTSVRSKTFDIGTAYNGGDFGGKLVPGKTYYFSVTALYADTKVIGNAVKLTIPKTQVPATSAVAVTASTSGSNVTVNWAHTAMDGLQGFKVVASQSNAHPSYPNDGYFFYITDTSVRSKTFDVSTAYNGGDFGGQLVPGKSYYFSVTALYDNSKVVGNAVRLTIPVTEVPVVTYPTPAVVGTLSNDGVILQWNAISNDTFQGYKVVVSETNPTPKYPDDGYLAYLTDPAVTSYTVKAGETFNGPSGAVTLEKGKTYYFSITAVYASQKVPGNVVRLTLP